MDAKEKREQGRCKANAQHRRRDHPADDFYLRSRLLLCNSRPNQELRVRFLSACMCHRAPWSVASPHVMPQPMMLPTATPPISSHQQRYRQGAAADAARAWACIFVWDAGCIMTAGSLFSRPHFCSLSSLRKAASGAHCICTNGALSLSADFLRVLCHTG